MKWIVVILVMLNLSVWLLGKKVDPSVQLSIRADQAKTINAESMSVVQPSLEMAQREVDEAAALEEEKLVQLKLDKRGKVLRLPSASNTETPSPVHKPIVQKPVVEAPKPVESEPVEIMALDRSTPVATAQPVQKIDKPANKPIAKNEPLSVAPVQAILKCYRIGPFHNQNTLASTRRALERSGIDYAVEERGAAQKIKAVRVYLGAYASTAALEAEKEQLKQMSIENYVVTLNGTPVIQLGYFSEPARANAYQKTLRVKGIEAKADTIYHEAIIDSWLEVAQASKEAISNLSLPRGATVKEQACR